VWVEPDLSVPDRPEVFVAGDLIAKTQDGKPLPGVAQLATQSGRHIARNIRADLAHRPRAPFHYVDKGSMATIGRNKAVAKIGRFEFTGIVAWWLWLTVHLLALVGYRSRVSVLTEWASAYFTWHRRSRVILEVPSEMAPLARPSMLGNVIRIPLTPPAPPKNGAASGAASGELAKPAPVAASH
jgi:NADH:ubiquinone reductase (H+-translocating)